MSKSKKPTRRRPSKPRASPSETPAAPDVVESADGLTAEASPVEPVAADHTPLASVPQDDGLSSNGTLAPEPVADTPSYTGPTAAPPTIGAQEPPSYARDLAERAKKAHQEIFDQNLTFTDLGLRATIQRSIDAMGWKHPTAIQAKLIPVALTGRDVLGQAKTGTGKTAAFGLPLIHMCSRETPFQALVLAPTRELAVQITDEINDLAKHTPIRALSVYGGQAIEAQARGLRRGAEIIVGTPGRVMDMVQRGFLHFRNIRFAVLDEVDRMLDIGFREDIRRILEMCPRPGVPVPPEHPSWPDGRQTIFVSATISPEIEKLARRYMRDPEKIVSVSGSLTVSLVEQHHLTVHGWDKRRLLLHLLTHEEPALTIVFCRLKRVVDELARYLNEHGIEAHAIHGDMSQGKRNSVMKELRAGKLEVLIASDLASRGIDVDDISHVINYDLPEDPDLYVHRIGRTARAGKHGVAWSFVTPEQGELLTNIELLINAEIPRKHYPDFTPSERPSHYRDDAPGGRREGGLVRADLPQVAPPPKKEPEAAKGTAAALPKDPAKVDPSKFPGGIVPTKLPPRQLFGRGPRR